MVSLLLLACADSAIDLRTPRPRRQDSADSASDTGDSEGDTGDSGEDTVGDTSADTSGDTAAPTDWSRPEGCGDDVVAGAEECDGDEDAACPGTCSAACQCPSAEATGLLSLYVIDVWQGDGMLLVSPDGFTMLVDAGDEDEYGGYARAILAAGYESLDYTVVSHQHVDHMGAMDLALDDHPEIGVAWDGGSRATSDGYDDYVIAAGARRTMVSVGQHLDLGPSIDVEVLHADIGDRDNENNNSVVLRVTYGDVSVLLGGDCEYEVCESSFDPGPIDVYKVHHHGAEDSSGPSLLRSMAPTLALISAGDGNDYGHPDDPTLQALAESGAEVWRTDEAGTIRVDIDGVGYSVAGE